MYRLVVVDVNIHEGTVGPCEELARLRIPNADRAVIEPTKLHDYLLSRGHPVGRFTAEVVSIWVVRTGEDVPRFVTAYPEGGR